MIRSSKPFAGQEVNSNTSATTVPSRHGANTSGHVSGVATTTTTQDNSRNSRNSTGKASSTGTNKVKKQQSNKLQHVKRMTITSVIVVDVILAVALIGQLISFDYSLTDFLRTKVKNTFAFYNFQYNERFGFSELGLSLYQNNSLTCNALFVNDSEAIVELRRRMRNDHIWRTNEVIALLDNTGRVVTSSGPASADGKMFNLAGLVDYYMQNHAQSGASLRISAMVDHDYYPMFGAPIFDAVNDFRPDLVSWDKQEQTLARSLLMPVSCGEPTVQGFIVNVDSITPRQYDYFGTLLFSTKSGMGGILARNTRTKQWQTAFSYNKAGPFGAKDAFPDMARDIFSDRELSAVVALGPKRQQTGTFTYESVKYHYSMAAVPYLSIGDTILQNSNPVDIVYLYAEPEAPIRQTMSRTMSWEIPIIVIMVLWSFISVHFVLRKFVEPMQKLIDSVKKKKMKEFNDFLRQLKSNKTAIWSLLLEVVIVECVLLGLIFANDSLLKSVSADFTSAVTEGKVLSYVVSSRANNLLYYLASWSASTTFVHAALNRTGAAEQLASVLQAKRDELHVDAISVIGLDSEIIASSYGPSIGLAIPESSIMEYLRSQRSPDLQTPFLAHTGWSEVAANLSTPGVMRGPRNSPVLTRLIVAPIRQLTLSNTSNSLEFGPLLGAIVIIRFLNGQDSIWQVDAFTPGYFGMFLWDVFERKFTDLTSVHKTSGEMLWGVDITEENPGILEAGVISQYNADQISVQDGTRIFGKSFTASVVPFSSAGEIVLSPNVVNSYLIRGLSQTDWELVGQRLLGVQIGIMIIVIAAALIKISLAWLPLRRFLNSLERVFTVQSVSDEQLTKREFAASAIIERGDVSQHSHRIAAPVLPMAKP